MKAAVYTGVGKIEVLNLQCPEVDADSALVRVEKVGICGTDIKTYKRGHPMFKPPCVLGHEFVGTVEKVGQAMDTNLVGRTFVIAPYLECGKCELCQKGSPELCKNKIWIQGAFAEYVKVPKVLLERGGIELPADVDRSTTTLTEPLACAMHGIERINPSKGDSILIVGAGPMGLLLGITLRNMGCTVAVSELDDNRLHKVVQFQLKAIDAKTTTLSQLSKEKSGFDHVIIATDSVSVIPEALEIIHPGGKLQLFGGMPRSTRLELDPYHIHYREVDFIGSFGFSEKHFKRAFAEIKNDTESYSKLVTAEYELDKIEEAFDAAMDPKNIKVVVAL